MVHFQDDFIGSSLELPIFNILINKRLYLLLAGQKILVFGGKYEKDFAYKLKRKKKKYI